MLTLSRLTIHPLARSHLAGSTKPATTSHHDPSPSDTTISDQDSKSKHADSDKQANNGTSTCSNSSSTDGRTTQGAGHITKDSEPTTKDDRPTTEDNEPTTKDGRPITKDSNSQCITKHDEGMFFLFFFFFECSYTGLYITYIPELATYCSQDQVGVALPTTQGIYVSI